MKIRFGLAAVATLAALMVSASAASADVTIGNADGGNCYPFSCGPSDALTEYQQAYSSSAFPGALNFNTVSFNSDVGGPIDTGTYAISFFYAANGVGALSANLPSNEGTSLGSFGTFSLSSTIPGTLSFTGSTIAYNPALGDLLMDVAVSNGTGFGYQTFFIADYTGTSVSRAFTNAAGSAVGTGALQTTFSTVVSAAPEPSAWMLMMLGVGGLGLMLRARRRKDSDPVAFPA